MLLSNSANDATKTAVVLQEKKIEEQQGDFGLVADELFDPAKVEASEKELEKLFKNPALYLREEAEKCSKKNDRDPNVVVDQHGAGW